MVLSRACMNSQPNAPEVILERFPGEAWGLCWQRTAFDEERQVLHVLDMRYMRWCTRRRFAMLRYFQSYPHGPHGVSARYFHETRTKCVSTEINNMGGRRVVPRAPDNPNGAHDTQELVVILPRFCNVLIFLTLFVKLWAKRRAFAEWKPVNNVHRLIFAGVDPNTPAGQQQQERKEQGTLTY